MEQAFSLSKPLLGPEFFEYRPVFGGEHPEYHHIHEGNEHQNCKRTRFHSREREAHAVGAAGASAATAVRKVSAEPTSVRI